MARRGADIPRPKPWTVKAALGQSQSSLPVPVVRARSRPCSPRHSTVSTGHVPRRLCVQSVSTTEPGGGDHEPRLAGLYRSDQHFYPCRRGDLNGYSTGQGVIVGPRTPVAGWPRPNWVLLASRIRRAATNLTAGPRFTLPARRKRPTPTASAGQGPGGRSNRSRPSRRRRLCERGDDALKVVDEEAEQV